MFGDVLAADRAMCLYSTVRRLNRVSMAAADMFTFYSRFSQKMRLGSENALVLFHYKVGRYATH